MVEIQKRAQRDIEHNKPQKTLQELHLLFGENAKAQGLSISQVEEWYEEAYQKAKPKKSWFEYFKKNPISTLGWGFFILIVLLQYFRISIKSGIYLVV
jgi:hypothetical protein